MAVALFDNLLSRLAELLTLIETYGKARIVGASLFFVCSRDYYDQFQESNDLKVVSVYLIDLCHMEIFEK